MAPITQICRLTQKPFVITDEDQAFYAKMGVPLPTLCPEERMRRRLAHRNERNLYLRKCDMTGKQIVSIYSQDKPFKVYEQKTWWSDDWNALDHGRDMDFSRPFFQQFKELQLAIPRLSIFNQNCENSEYTNQSYDNKDCYLCSAIGNSTDLLYVQNGTHLKDCLDCSYSQNSELLYQCIDTYESYKSRYLQQCIQCSDSWFLYDCVNCKNCFGCVGLRNKEYHIWNKPYSKEEYEAKLLSFKLDDSAQLEHQKKTFQDHLNQLPHVFAWIKNSENVSGNNIRNSSKAFDCFDVFDIQDCSHSSWIFRSKDVFDAYGTGKSQHAIECISVENADHVGFSTVTSDSHNCWYTDLCFYSKNCFGSIGLKRKEYCILNKQYSKEEYETLLPKIIAHMKKTGEWGEFFPMSISPFAYNETVAQEFYPLKKEDASHMGLLWFETKDVEKYQGPRVVIPANISATPDNITQAILTCETSGKLYKIIPQELAFYRKMGLPIPHLCPDQRHLERMAKRNPRKLWNRTCEECSASIQTSYAPERPEKVLCEPCYLKATY